MNGHEAAGGIEYFLSKSNRVFVCIYFFDIAGAPASAAREFAKIASAATRQFFPLCKRSFVLRPGSHRRQNILRAGINLARTQP